MALNLKKGQVPDLRKESIGSIGKDSGSTESNRKKTLWPYLLLALLVVGGLVGFMVLRNGKAAKGNESSVTAMSNSESADNRGTAAVATPSATTPGETGSTVSGAAGSTAVGTADASPTAVGSAGGTASSGPGSATSGAGSSAQDQAGTSGPSAANVPSSSSRTVEPSEVASGKARSSRSDVKVLFEFNSATVSESAKGELSGIGQNAAGYSKVVIVGHSCDVGSEEAKVAISSLRAEAVRDYLSSIGVAVKMEVSGVADREPVSSTDVGSDRANNRCVTLRFE